MFMNFSQALKEAKNGNGVAREDWNGKGLIVRAQFPDEGSANTFPYLYIDAAALGGGRGPWVPSQTDLFGEDWRIVEEVEHSPEPKA